MAKRKLKLTPFARFLIFVLFAAPLAYLAAAYLNDQDGAANIKGIFTGDSSEKQEAPTAQNRQSPSSDTAILDCDALQQQVESLEDQIQKLRSDNLKLMEDLEATRKDVLELQNSGGVSEPSIQ